MKSPDRTPPRLRFATTHWSLVLAAGQAASSPAQQALAVLCQTYWYPLYAFARRFGHSADQAQDLTQEFFARLLEKNFLAAANPARGRFRSFLLAAFKHFLAHEWEKAGALKRGGGRTILSLDFAAGAQRYTAEPSHDLTAERVFEREWALTLIEQALAKLQAEAVNGGRQQLFERVKPLLAGDQADASYFELADDLRITPGALKTAVHRLRKRFGQLIREELANTVAQPADVEDELAALFTALRPRG